MSYRFVRIIVFFDLPTETLVDRRNYSRVRKLLLRAGFFMMQESVYSKLVLNSTVSESFKNLIRREKPPKGLVQMLTITEKQYASIENIVGEVVTNVINSTERCIDV